MSKLGSAGLIIGFIILAYGLIIKEYYFVVCGVATVIVSFIYAILNGK